MIEYEIRWWKEWLEGDIITRTEMVNKSPFLKMILDLKNIKGITEEDKVRMAATQLNGIFEDLEGAVYTKIEIENENKEKRKE